MCDIEEAAPRENLGHTGDTIWGRKCMKCKENSAVVVIRTNDPLCRECFLAYSIHKFRMTFGKARVIDDKEHLLIAYSGGTSSAALTHLVIEGRSSRAKRPLRFVPKLVYVQEGAVLGYDGVEEARATQQVVTLMEKSGIPFLVYDLSQIFEADPQPLHRREGGDNSQTITENERTEIALPSQSAREQLKQLLSSCTSLTSKQALVNQLRLSLLERIAESCGVRKVMMGDNGNQLAIRMLTDITQGRGANLAQQMGFIDNSRSELMVLRPLKGFTTKEIVTYNTLNQVESTFVENLSTKVGAGGSLQRLTEEFITGLQQDFPNTVYTVCRTGEKLDVSAEAQDSEQDKCALCQSLIDTNVGDSSALSATVFSQQICDRDPQTMAKAAGQIDSSDTSSETKLSIQRVNGGACKDGSSECCGEGDGSCRSQATASQLPTNALQASLCYACRLMVRDMKRTDVLPSYVLQAAGKRQRREQMREEIRDFIID